MLRSELALLIAFVAACASRSQTAGNQEPRTDQLEGRWRACLTEETRAIGPVCGTLEVRPYASERAGQPIEGFLLEHDVDLRRVLRSRSAIPAHGALHAAGTGTWSLLLGVDESITDAADTGLHGTLAWSGDSLVGHWSLSCFALCAEAGTVAMWRAGNP